VKLDALALPASRALATSASLNLDGRRFAPRQSRARCCCWIVANAIVHHDDRP
jgi:hypothetical protein